MLDYNYVIKTFIIRFCTINHHIFTKIEILVLREGGRWVVEDIHIIEFTTN